MCHESTEGDPHPRPQPSLQMSWGLMGGAGGGGDRGGGLGKGKVIMNAGAEGAEKFLEHYKWSKWFVFSQPPQRADSKNPIFILCRISGLGHLRGPRGSVSVGVWGALGGGSSLRAVSPPPPPPFESPPTHVLTAGAVQQMGVAVPVCSGFQVEDLRRSLSIIRTHPESAASDHCRTLCNADGCRLGCQGPPGGLVQVHHWAGPRGPPSRLSSIRLGEQTMYVYGLALLAPPEVCVRACGG